VRSLFAVRAGPRLRTLGPVLRGAHSLDHLVYPTAFEAEVAAARVVHALEPRFNTSAGRWRAYRYVRPVGVRSPRAAVARVLPAGGAAEAGWLGPVPSTAAARRVVAAIQAGGPDVGERMRRAAGGDGEALLAPLWAHHRELADERRDDEAATVAGHAAVLGAVLERQARLDALRSVDHLVLDLSDGTRVDLRRGRLARTCPGPTPDDPLTTRGHGGPRGDELARVMTVDPDGMVLPPRPEDGPVPVELVDELVCVARWLARAAPHTLAEVVGGA
jgi:hypothetical protein